MPTTTNYGWTTPADTDLVKDGASAIRTLGTAIDTTVFNNASAAIAKSIVDAKGDIIAATAADTVSRLAVGANNTILTADSSTATGLKWAAPAPAGKVLQVVTASYSTATTINTTALTDSGLSVSITPTSASSKILILVAQELKVTGGANNDTAGQFAIDRSGSTIVTVGPTGYEAFSSTTTSQIRLVFNYSYLDSPATTSSITYKTQYAKFGTATVTAQDNSAPSQITVLEIGA